jgi:zona occludens toxin
MSIVAYVGKPGSGKSYAAVEHQVLPLLKAGRCVVTNLALKFDLLRKDFPGADLREFPAQAIALQPDLIYDAVPPGAVLILDEVWRIFAAGVKANQVPEPFRALFAEHRHKMNAAGQSTQIVLCALDLAGISAFARQLVEQTFYVTKLSTLGIPSRNRYRVDMYPGPVAGSNPPAANRIRQVFGKYEKSVYQYYQSHTQSEAGEGVVPDEAGADKRANIFKKPFLVALPFIALAVGVFLWFKGGYLLNKYHKKPDAVAASAPSGASGAAATASSHPSFFGSALAKVEGAGDWKVIGTLRNAEHPDKSFAILRSDTLKQTLEVKLSKCIIIDEQPTRCSYDGFMYSSDGKAAVAVNSPLGIAPPIPGAQPPLPPTLAEARPLDPYTNQVLEEDPKTGLVAFRKPRVSRGGLSVASVR